MSTYVCNNGSRWVEGKDAITNAKCWWALGYKREWTIQSWGCSMLGYRGAQKGWETGVTPENENSGRCGCTHKLLLSYTPKNNTMPPITTTATLRLPHGGQCSAWDTELGGVLCRHQCRRAERVQGGGWDGGAVCVPDEASALKARRCWQGAQLINYVLFFL